MLEVSESWQEASMAQFRYQAYLIMTLEVAPPGLRQGLEVTSEDSFEQSDIGIITNGIYEEPTKYASFELNRWSLDGSFSVLPKNATTVDWWSLIPSEDNPVTIVFNFDNVYDIPGIYVNWDRESGTYPREFTIVGYSNTGTEIYREKIDYTNSVTQFYNITMDSVRKVELIVTEWAVPNWRVRITEVTFGIYADFSSQNNGRISSATSTSKADPLSSQLPTHSMNITFRNLDKYFDPTLTDGISKYLAKQQVMHIKWEFMIDSDTKESTKPLTYILQDFEIPDDSKDVSINFTNRLSLLTNDFTKGTYTGSNRTLYSLAEYVLENSNIYTEYSGQKPWVLDESLKEVSTTAPIPLIAINIILQYIALVSCNWLTVEGESGFILFKPIEEEVEELCEINETQELGDPGITISDTLKTVSVSVYNYFVDATSKEIGTAEYILTGTRVVTIKYNVSYATSVSASVNGATVSDSQFYCSCAILTLVANGTNSVVKVTLTGKEIQQNVSYIQAYDDLSINDGRAIIVDNPFITNIDSAVKVAEHVKNYYLKRTKYSVPYIGYPQLEAGDRIRLHTIYGESAVDVTNNTITFNGGWTGAAEVI